MLMRCRWEEEQQGVVRDGAADDGTLSLEGLHDGLALLMRCRCVKREQLLRAGGEVAPGWVVHCVCPLPFSGHTAPGAWGVEWIDGGNP